mmetsp:Transcript_3226/g.9816  ORF Transcript_3226/g.9816 Transcript_3226/m.9816 type:complete len:309 (-) Transcript_3226:1473-2399(-)
MLCTLCVAAQCELSFPLARRLHFRGHGHGEVGTHGVGERRNLRQQRRQRSRRAQLREHARRSRRPHQVDAFAGRGLLPALDLLIRTQGVGCTTSTAWQLAQLPDDVHATNARVGDDLELVRDVPEGPTANLGGLLLSDFQELDSDHHAVVGIGFVAQPAEASPAVRLPNVVLVLEVPNLVADEGPALDIQPFRTNEEEATRLLAPGPVAQRVELQLQIIETGCGEGRAAQGLQGLFVADVVGRLLGLRQALGDPADAPLDALHHGGTQRSRLPGCGLGGVGHLHGGRQRRRKRASHWRRNIEDLQSHR